VRAALLQTNKGHLTECLARQANAFADCQTVQAARIELRQKMDTAPSGSPTALLRGLICQLDMPVKGQLLTQLERLRRVASEVDRINRANQLCVRHALTLTERLLVDLTGGEPAGQPYNRAGTVGPSAYGRLLEARG
jgi:hypothetical protein